MYNVVIFSLGTQVGVAVITVINKVCVGPLVAVSFYSTFVVHNRNFISQANIANKISCCYESCFICAITENN